MRKLLAVLVSLVFLAGCRNPLFNPKADARLLTFTDISNVALASLTLSGTAPHNIKAQVVIVNGVDTNFTDCAIDYYRSSGSVIPVTSTSKIATSINGTGTNATPVTGYITFPLTNADLTAYKTTNSLSSVNCLVTLSGEDVNGNQVSVSGGITIY